ncbi:hypothetical protein [Geopseudomonas aromaticivorans]
MSNQTTALPDASTFRFSSPLNTEMTRLISEWVSEAEQLEAASGPASDAQRAWLDRAYSVLARIKNCPAPAPTAWSDAQVRDFLSVALRHIELGDGSLKASDINDALRYMAEKGAPAFVSAPGDRDRLPAEIMAIPLNHPELDALSEEHQEAFAFGHYEGRLAAAEIASRFNGEAFRASEAIKAAVEALYFNDSSDYLAALFAVVQALAPALAEQIRSLDHASLKRAFDTFNPPENPDVHEEHVPEHLLREDGAIKRWHPFYERLPGTYYVLAREFDTQGQHLAALERENAELKAQIARLTAEKDRP